MNCDECRDKLVACVERLLDGDELVECRAHLDKCAACSAEYQAIATLQQQLVHRGQAAADVAIVDPVMRRVLREPEQKETVMSRLMKYRWGFGLGAAAGAVVVVVLSIAIFVTPKAFGIDRVIQAYNKIRYLHVKEFGAKSKLPNEFWIKSNDQGQVVEARYYLPKTEDGAKLITWTPERTEIWFQRKRGFLVFQTKRIAPWMQSLLDQSQPQLILTKSLAAQKAGKARIEIQDPQGKDKPGTIVVTLGKAHRKDIFYQIVYQIDPETDLISRIEHYHLRGTNEVLASTTEFSDYNVPIPEKMFSLRDELPKDVRIADTLNQLTGVAQGNMTDAQAAAETARQFFQALVDKDYKKAGLIYGGELEQYAKAEFGGFNVGRIISVGPAVLQTNWVKRGYRVPCTLEVVQPDGTRFAAKSGPYVRPGDDEMHPDRWHITGGTDLIPTLPDEEKYEKMTAGQAAEAFFKACSERNWDEARKFWTFSAPDKYFERMKEYLGGLQIISIGKAYQSAGYPGWHVPYEIKLAPRELNVRVSNANPAKRYVITGLYNSQLKLEQDLQWTNAPAVLPDNNVDAGLSPAEVVKRYFAAAARLDWDEMRKFAPGYDVDHDKAQTEAAQKEGADVTKLMPTVEVGETFWSPEQSAWFVKCRMLQVKKWKLAIRNDNPAHRWQVDGGI